MENQTTLITAIALLFLVIFSLTVYILSYREKVQKTILEAEREKERLKRANKNLEAINARKEELLDYCEASFSSVNSNLDGLASKTVKN